jgi:hypothetical protein
LLRSNKPIRLALGRWENVDSFWKNLVVDKQLHHLQSRGTPWSTPAIDALALGDEVFAGIKIEPETIIARTKHFFLNNNIVEFHFDLNRMKTATSSPTRLNEGFYAREELKILLNNPELLSKTTFYRMGIPVTPSIDYLKRLIKHE